VPVPPQTVIAALGVALALLLFAPTVAALPAPVGAQAGHPVQAAKRPARHHPNGPCNVEVPVIGGILNEIAGGVCGAAGEVAGAAAGIAGEAASAVGNGILDLLAKWMIAAATQVTTFVSREMQQTTTPQLQSAWYRAQFAPMADLGAALGLLVALLALASAAIRRSPQALAATIAGIARAGIGTGMVLAFTTIGLGVADQVSSAVISSSPHAFWATVAHAWGTSGFGGFGSSALAMLIALVEVFAAIFVWLELIVRGAAIYAAVLFFPVALAAAIWPALGAWPHRLGRLLLLFVILKPVALIVLSLAGSAAAAGLSLNAGISGSVGTILAATVIFGLAAFAPWALMYLLAADAESAFVAAGVRTAAAGAVAEKHGRSVRSGGGLANLAANGSGGPGAGGSSGGGGSSAGGGPAGGGAGPGGGGGGPGGAAGAPPAAGAGTGASGAESDGTLALGAESIGAGSVGAAAGMSAPGVPASSEGSAPQGGSPAGSPGESASQGESHGSALPQRSLATEPLQSPDDGRAPSPPAAGGAATAPSPQRHERGSAGARSGQDTPGHPHARPSEYSGDGAAPGGGEVVPMPPRSSRRSSRRAQGARASARLRPVRDSDPGAGENR
jgi:hypothetical protein